MSNNVTEYLRGQIMDLLETKLTLSSKGMLFQNRIFENSLKEAVETETALPRISSMMKDYEELFFKIKSLEWDISRMMSELERLMTSAEYAKFRWTEFPDAEKKMTRKILTSDDFSLESAA